MTGMSIAALALALAVLVRPGAFLVSARLAALHPPADRVRRRLGPPLAIFAALAVGMVPVALGGGLAGVAVGLPLGFATFLGTRWSVRRTARRQARAPDPLLLASSWDLLAACLRGGLPVPDAVRIIAADAPGPAADALRHTADLLALGSDPVAAWAPALAESCTAELARGARRSARSGAALAAVAEGLATAVRSGADDLAEARAQRAAVAVAGPLGLCFLPAFLCVGVVPVVIGLASRLLASW
ncbi:MAG TPA: type II secretion system F family protein [Pseudonocardiaceae bacterium]|jgi:Flp pilus assembly protein TadB|nr:type II secretion system F family protein [Pseudonocardiaceae bacterium]